MVLFAVPLIVRSGEAAEGPVRSRPALRVFVPGQPTETVRLPPIVREALGRVGARAQPVAPSQWAELTPEAADFLLLSRPAVPYLERATAAEIDALDELVARGVPLVVIGTAAGALSDSHTFSRLLGRAPPPARESTTPKGPADVAVAILNQRDRVTQCVPHLVLRKTVITAVGTGGTVLAAGVRATEAKDDAALTRNLRQVFWSKTHRRGRVVVLGLEVEPPGTRGNEAGVDSTERHEQEILATLLGRVLELHGRGRTGRVTLQLPAVLPLAARRLGPDDTGLLPGLAPLPGFYRGRQIAAFMTYHGADWLVRPDREKTERPEAVLDSLELTPGSTVVDLGAGVGYFSERMARRVGPRGKVLAVDIQEEMLEMLVRRMNAAGIQNVVPVLATADDPRLPSDSVDLVLMVDVYHELSDPAPVIAHVHDSLRKGGPERKPGRLVLVEYRGEDPTVEIKPLHRMTVGQARAELEPLGFHWVETKSFLPHQHVIVFERKALKTRE